MSQQYSPNDIDDANLQYYYTPQSTEYGTYYRLKTARNGFPPGFYASQRTASTSELSAQQSTSASTASSSKQLSPRLYVAFYKPHYGNFAHWALYLEHGPEHIIFQVVGETPNFTQNVTNTRPDQSSHTGNIFMCEVNKQDIEALKNTVAAVPIDNSNSSWDCQEYVLDVLDKLEDECIVDGDGVGYRRAKQSVKNRRGGSI